MRLWQDLRYATMAQAQAELGTLDGWRIEEGVRGSKDPLARQARLEVASAKTGLATLRDHFAKPLLALTATTLLAIEATNIPAAAVWPIQSRLRDDLLYHLVRG